MQPKLIARYLFTPDEIKTSAGEIALKKAELLVEVECITYEKAFIYHRENMVLKLGRLLEGLTFKQEPYAPIVRLDTYGHTRFPYVPPYNFLSFQRGGRGKERPGPPEGRHGGTERDKQRATP